MDGKTKKKLDRRVLLAMAVLVLMITAAVFAIPTINKRVISLICDERTGFCEDKTIENSVETNAKGQTQKLTVITKPQPGKTLWDWLELCGTLAVPVLLAYLGYQFQRRDQERANENLRDEALQAYIDRISELLLDRNLSRLTDKDPARDVARTITLTILRRLSGDGGRKGDVIRFLIDAELVSGAYKLNLRDADLSLAYLRRAHLEDVELPDADLNNAVLRRAHLENANLDGANLVNADLYRAHLENADLKRVDLRQADLRQANLRKADLREADLRGVKIDDETTLDAKWHLVWKIINQEVKDQDLEEEDLSSANLEDAKLTGANLKYADLKGANLRQADLRRAKLMGANLEDVDLKGANLRQADLRQAKLMGANLEDADLKGTNLRQADLWQAKLMGANLEDAHLEGVKNCIPDKIKTAKNSEKAHYSPNF